MRTIGEGNLSKALWFLGAAVVVLVVLTWLEPFMQRYEVKTGARVLCADMIKHEDEVALSKRRGTAVRFDEKQVMTNFLNNLRRAAVKLNAGDFDADCGDYLDKDEPHCFSYSYAYDSQAEQHVCTIHVRYRTDTQPAVIGQVLQELPHLKMQHHINMVQRVNKSF